MGSGVTSKLDDLSVAIGGLRSDMKHLSNKVESHLEETRNEQRKVHDIVDATAEAVRNLNAKVLQMEPLVSDYREKRAEQRGARRFVRGFYIMAGGAVGAVVAKVIDVFAMKPH